MPTAQVVCYHPEFARLKDSEGKSLGPMAALMLSQAAWLTEHQADEHGWFLWSQVDCEQQTGLNRQMQETARQRLQSAGLLAWERYGEKGRLRYRMQGVATTEQDDQLEEIPQTEQNPVCRKPANRNGQFAGKSQTETPVREEIAGKSQTENKVSLRESRKLELPDSGKVANRNAGIPQTETQSVSFLSNKKTNQDTPPKGVPPPAPVKKPGRVGFVPPDRQEAIGFIVEELHGSRDDAESFFDHFASNGWKVGGKTTMADWKAAARNWVRRSAQYAAERKVKARASPQAGLFGQRPRDWSMKDTADELDAWFPPTEED